jgi:hypothetical protein
VAPAAKRRPARLRRKAGRSGVTPDGKVILNSADVKDLTRLPGRKRRAERIIELRTRLKPFRRVTDLLRVRGIGCAGCGVFSRIVLDPPATTDAG